MSKHQKMFSTILKSKISQVKKNLVYRKQTISANDWYFVIDSQVCQKFRSDYYSDHKKK